MPEENKIWPKKGERLVHASRKTGETYEAEVLDVDKTSGIIQVRVRGTNFPSLSAAASNITGSATNGWVYWGLKKQKPRKR